MADQYTVDLLTKWGCAHLTDTFRDARIDAVALGLLKEIDISSLIPLIGDRVKFQANLSMWKADNESGNVNENSTLSPVLVSDASLNRIIDDLQGTDKYEVVTLQVPADCPPQPDRNKIKSILESTHRGRALLKSEGAIKGLLDSSQRKELAHLILDSVLNENPDIQLTWPNFQSWARGIGELFSNESPVLYYASYIPAGAFQLKRNASGILYNTYLRKRKNLIKRKVTAPFRKRRAASESSDLSSDLDSSGLCPVDLSIIDENESDFVEEALLAITIAVEGTTPWQEIDKSWAITTKLRLQKLYNEKGSLLDYLNEYQVLKGPSGYKLLIADFERLYPATGADILRASLQNVSGSIIDKGKTLLTSTKDQFLKLALTELIRSIDDDLENKLNVSLLLLPLLMNITPLKGKGVKRTSKTVVRDSFILRVSASANLEACLADQRETLRALKITFQPIVVYIGESVRSVEKCYVIVEDTLYELPSILPGVDVAFKIFHATATKYPILAHDIWFFIQKGFYNITTRYDPRISQSVKTFLVDLGLKERC